MHPASMDEDKLLAECELTSGRGSGPGGQNRNKVETAVRIKHLPTGLTASATERRHKEQNRRQALFRLRIKLAVSCREPVDPAAPVHIGDATSATSVLTMAARPTPPIRLRFISMLMSNPPTSRSRTSRRSRRTGRPG